MFRSFARIATTANAGSNRVKPILNRYVPATTVVEHLATAEQLVRLVKILQFFNCENQILHNHEKTCDIDFYNNWYWLFMDINFQDYSCEKIWKIFDGTVVHSVVLYLAETTSESWYRFVYNNMDT